MAGNNGELVHRDRGRDIKSESKKKVEKQTDQEKGTSFIFQLAHTQGGEGWGVGWGGGGGRVTFQCKTEKYCVCHVF